LRGEFVLIVAITPDQKVVLVREYKQAVEQVLLGLPAGAVKKGESPTDAALRELREESGYVGDTDSCQAFGPFFNSPDKSTEKHHVVLVRGVWKQGPADPEESETILGVQLCDRKIAKSKMQIGMHRMAVDVALEFLAGR